MSTPPTSDPVVLVVDDDESVRRALGRLLRSGGMQTALFGSGEDLLDAVDELDPSCAIVDVHLPGMDGFQVHRALAKREPDLPVFLITGNDDNQTTSRARASGAAGFLIKPFSHDDLLETVLRAVRSTCVQTNGHRDRSTKG